MISEHFAATEFGDAAAGVVPAVSPELLTGLEDLRRLVNQWFPSPSGKERPILITSGYRSPAHNAEVGGAGKSQHMTDPLLGCDIVIPGVPLLESLRAVFQIPVFVRGGIGLYPHDGHIHVDVRPNGPATWIS